MFIKLIKMLFPLFLIVTQLSQKDEDILEIITYLGLSLSIIGMILTIIMYSLFA